MLLVAQNIYWRGSYKKPFPLFYLFYHRTICLYRSQHEQKEGLFFICAHPNNKTFPFLPSQFWQPVGNRQWLLGAREMNFIANSRAGVSQFQSSLSLEKNREQQKWMLRTLRFLLIDTEVCWGVLEMPNQLPWEEGYPSCFMALENSSRILSP